MTLKEFIDVLKKMRFESYEISSKERQKESYIYFGQAGFAYHSDCIEIRKPQNDLLLATYASNEKERIDEQFLNMQFVRCDVDLRPYKSNNGYHDSASSITFYVE